MCDGGGGGGGDHRRPSRDCSPDCAASPPPGRSLASYLMQLSGSRSQSVLHMNLSQCSQPIVGCRARPLSSASAAGGGRRPSSERRNTPPSISIHLLSQRTMVNNATVSPLDLFPDAARFSPAHLLLLPWMTDVKTDQWNLNASVTVQWRPAATKRGSGQVQVTTEKQSADTKDFNRDFYDNWSNKKSRNVQTQSGLFIVSRAGRLKHVVSSQIFWLGKRKYSTTSNNKSCIQSKRLLQL